MERAETIFRGNILSENTLKTTEHVNDPTITAKPSGDYIDFDDLEKDERDFYDDDYFQFHPPVPDFGFDSIDDSKNEEDKNSKFDSANSDDDDDIRIQNIKSIPPKIIGFDPVRCTTGYQTFKIYVEESTWLSGFCIFNNVFVPSYISTLHNYECSYKIWKEGHYNISFAQDKDTPPEKWLPVGILRVKGKAPSAFDMTTLAIIIGFVLFLGFSIYFAIRTQAKQNDEQYELPY